MDLSAWGDGGVVVVLTMSIPLTTKTTEGPVTTELPLLRAFEVAAVRDRNEFGAPDLGSVNNSIVCHSHNAFTDWLKSWKLVTIEFSDDIMKAATS